MKVLVSGGTGFIGKRVLERLRANGHEIAVLTRNPAKVGSSLAQPVRAFAWRPEDELPPEEAFAGVEGVIHLAGEGIAERRWSTAQKKRILDSRVLGTRHLVQAIAKAAPGVKTLVSASAIGFYGDRPGETLDESSKPSTGFLSEVCQAWEKEAERAPKNVRTVRMRIGIVLGDGGGALKKLLPLFRLGFGGPIGNGTQQMSWIHVDDLASLCVFALENEGVTGALNATAPSPVSSKEFSRALGFAVHRPAVLPAPPFALKLAMGEMSDLVLASQRVLPTEATKLGFQFKYAELADALEDVCKKKSS